jgi:twitching motility two-component system response regulator PilH
LVSHNNSRGSVDGFKGSTFKGSEVRTTDNRITLEIYKGAICLNLEPLNPEPWNLVSTRLKRRNNTMSQKVLVVDDDPDVRLFSVTVLEENGYTPLEAEDGESGLKKIKSEKPDLVILDVLMPRQSGVRLYRELKTSKALKDVKVIILSGIAKKTFMRSQKALTEFGGAEIPEPEIYLEKPVEPDELADVIKKVLG